MLASTLPASAASDSSLNAPFLALLPRLRTHAAIYFRDVTCPDTKDDRITETVALAWKWHRSLHERGKDITRFPMAFVVLVARAVKSGRRLCGHEKVNEVLSPVAQRRRGFQVQSLPSSTGTSLEILNGPHGQQMRDACEEMLHDNTQTPVPDQVAFRLDWPAYLRSLSDRDRRLAAFLALGHSASKAAKAFGITPSRVTQLRQRWCRDWRRFQGDEPVGCGQPE